MSDSKRTRGLIGLVGAIGSAASAAIGLRQARQKGDGLMLLNASASALAAVTGIWIAVRKLRRGGKAV